MNKIGKFAYRQEIWGVLLQDLKNDRIWAVDNDIFRDLLEGRTEKYKNSLFLDNPFLYKNNFILGSPDIDRSTELKAPISLSWEVTNRCNSNCIFCCNDANIRLGHELNLVQIKDYIDYFDMWKVMRIAVAGGEPLMRDDIYDILEYLGEKGMPYTLATNSIALKREKLGLLKDTCCNIQISLDTLNRELYAHIRGNDAIMTVKQNIEKLVREGINVRISTVITKLNYQELNQMAVYLHDIGIKQWFWFHLLPAGRARNMYSELKCSDRRYLIEEITKIRETYEDMAVFLWGDKPEDSTAVYLRENGDFVLRDYFSEEKQMLGKDIHEVSKLWDIVDGRSKIATLLNFTQKIY